MRVEPLVDRDGGGEVMAVPAHAFQLGFHLPLAQGHLEQRLQRLARGLPRRVERADPRVAHHLVGRVAVDAAGALGPGEHLARKVQRQDSVVRRALQHAMQEGRRLGKLLRLLLHLLRLAKQLDEHADLGAQRIRIDRLENVVDGPNRVAAGDEQLIAARGGQEDDRRVARALAVADQLGRVEAIHLGHLHVEQNHREIGLEQVTERFQPRRRVHELAIVARQDRVERQEVLGLVVDEEDVHRGQARGAADALHDVGRAKPRAGLWRHHRILRQRPVLASKAS
jgi:hypothetical protein